MNHQWWFMSFGVNYGKSHLCIFAKEARSWKLESAVPVENWRWQRGIAFVWQEGKSGPGAPVLRQHLELMIVRFLRFSAPLLSPPSQPISSFTVLGTWNQCKYPLWVNLRKHTEKDSITSGANDRPLLTNSPPPLSSFSTHLFFPYSWSMEPM